MRLLPSLGGERSLSRNPDGPDTLGAVRASQTSNPPRQRETVGRTWSQFSLGVDASLAGLWACAQVDLSRARSRPALTSTSAPLPLGSRRSLAAAVECVGHRGAGGDHALALSAG